MERNYIKEHKREYKTPKMKREIWRFLAKKRQWRKDKLDRRYWRVFVDLPRKNFEKSEGC